MELVLKGCIGALVVIAVDLLARTKNFYLAGLLLLFPALTVIAHFLIGAARGTEGLQQTIIFGAISILPYMTYLAGVYLLAPRLPLTLAIIGALAAWGIVASVVVFLYR